VLKPKRKIRRQRVEYYLYLRAQSLAGTTQSIMDQTFSMKNISLILNGILLLAVAHLYYLTLKKPAAAAAPTTTVAALPTAGGARIAYVNADTLDAKYDWLKQQKAAIAQRIQSGQSSMASKQSALESAFAALQEKAQTGKYAQAELQKEAEGLDQRRQKLAEEASKLERSLMEEQKKANNELYANLEEKLKKIRSQIGYDYILSYTRGGEILLANDSLDITKQVLGLLNSK
jgi:outer membrane protein